MLPCGPTGPVNPAAPAGPCPPGDPEAPGGPGFPALPDGEIKKYNNLYQTMNIVSTQPTQTFTYLKFKPKKEKKIQHKNERNQSCKQHSKKETLRRASSEASKL